MANYTKTTDFEIKDSLPSGDPGKIIKGTEFEVEFDAISASIATKADQAGPTFTGTSTFGAVNVTGSFTSLGIDDNGTSTAITIDGINDVAITNGLTVDGTTLVVNDTTNRVGIGDTNPSEKLSVLVDDGGQVKLTGVGGNAGSAYYSVNDRARFGFTAGVVSIDDKTSAGTTTSKSFAVDLGGTERFRVGSNGYVGIGVAAPNTILEVQAPDTSTDSALTLTVPSSSTHDPVVNFRLIGNTIWSAGADATDGHFKIGRGGSLNNIANANLTIDTSGNVGIGAENPSTQLHIKNGGTIISRLESTTTGGQACYSHFLNENGSWYSGTTGAGEYQIYDVNAATSRLRIKADGSVGIGTSTPAATAKLDVVGGAIRVYNGTGVTTGFLENRADTTDLRTVVGNGALTFSTGPTTAGTERMRIDSNGNVDIGTGNLEVSSGLDNRLTGLFKGASYAVRIGSTADAAVVEGVDTTGTTSYQPLELNGSVVTVGTGAGGTEKMRIETNGNVLVGKDANTATDAGLTFLPSGRANFVNNNGGASATVQAFYNSNATAAGSISITSTATSYNVSSDERLKENIVDAPAGNIDALQVRSFDWKVNREHQTYGFIAQELEAAAPYAVTKGETEDDTWAVDYSKLVPMLVKEIQDLKAKVEALENA